MPAWLADESVRKAIQHLLDHDRCLEEATHLCKERTAMQQWMCKEWDVIQIARAKNGMMLCRTFLFDLYF